MDYSTCYNCGEQGHFASSCPAGIDITETPKPRGNHPPQWQNAPLLPRGEQARVNERGVALCRAALARPAPQPGEHAP